MRLAKAIKRGELRYMEASRSAGAPSRQLIYLACLVLDTENERLISDVERGELSVQSAARIVCGQPAQQTVALPADVAERVRERIGERETFSAFVRRAVAEYLAATEAVRGSGHGHGTEEKEGLDTAANGSSP